MAISSVQTTETLVVATALQVAAMIGAARIMNGLFRAAGQPGVVGEIVAGLLLGPSLFGFLFPDLSAALFGAKASPAITILSQIGLILLMFQIGSDFEFQLLGRGRNRVAVFAIAFVSIAVPFGAGLAFGQISAPVLANSVQAIPYSLFCGVAVAITAVPILGRILREFDLTRTELGVVAISAAALNDVCGWVMLAAISAVAAGAYNAGSTLWQLAGLAALLGFIWFGLRPLSDRVISRFEQGDDPLPPNLMAIVLVTIFGLATCTFKLGVFSIFGGFIGGLVVHQHHRFVAAWRERVGKFVQVFFLPIFFTFTGLRTNVLGLTLDDAGWLAALLALSILAKTVPVFFAARGVGFSTAESAVLGTLMNTRALMELIVLNVGFDLGVLPQKVFTMLVIMAVVTTLMTGPLLQRLLPSLGYGRRHPVEA